MKKKTFFWAKRKKKHSNFEFFFAHPEVVAMYIYIYILYIYISIIIYLSINTHIYIYKSITLLGELHPQNVGSGLDHWLCANSSVGFRCLGAFFDYECRLIGAQRAALPRRRRHALLPLRLSGQASSRAVAMAMMGGIFWCLFG